MVLIEFPMNDLIQWSKIPTTKLATKIMKHNGRKFPFVSGIVKNRYFKEKIQTKANY